MPATSLTIDLASRVPHPEEAGNVQLKLSAAKGNAMELRMRSRRIALRNFPMKPAAVLILWCLGAVLVLSAVHRRSSSAAYADGSGFSTDKNVKQEAGATVEKATNQPDRRDLPLPPPRGIRSFTGRVVKVADHYLLKDALLGRTYDVDPQPAVRGFEGMTVRLDGSLDSRGKTIRLEHPWRY
ncbi:MAG: hypothetical protein JO356_19960 [Acidobacteria bacterium]|nr:hypothetical protein [Acidobacteriota bacterium]